MSFGITELLLILAVVIVVFGAGKLPRAMKDVGLGIKALREGMSGDAKTLASSEREESKQE
jgi:sec-independent protein translocase protein TatA